MKTLVSQWVAYVQLLLCQRNTRFRVEWAPSVYVSAYERFDPSGIDAIKVFTCLFIAIKIEWLWRLWTLIWLTSYFLFSLLVQLINKSSLFSNHNIFCSLLTHSQSQISSIAIHVYWRTWLHNSRNKFCIPCSFWHGIDFKLCSMFNTLTLFRFFQII